MITKRWNGIKKEKKEILIPSITENIKEIEIEELKSLVDSIRKKKIKLSFIALKQILNKELNIQVLSDKEINELINPIKEFIIT